MTLRDTPIFGMKENDLCFADVAEYTVVYTKGHTRSLLEAEDAWSPA